MARMILHVDQNCYFASVEMISRPEYRTVPMAVVGDASKRHGIILAKNQLASQAGVKTAEAIWQAEQKCPGLVKVPAHTDSYLFYSEKLKQMYCEYSDRVESFGLDECWIDITGCSEESSKLIADEIRERVKDEMKLTCSVGVSFNKIFAKLGSDYKKPDATTVITEDNYKEIVWPLPVSDLLFVGSSTRDRLLKVNIRTIGDLARSDCRFISDYLGKTGAVIWLYANGADESPVKKAFAGRRIKSVGNSVTMPADMRSASEVRGTLLSLSEKVAGRLRKHGLLASGIQLYIRDKNLFSVERQRSFCEPTDNAGRILETAYSVFVEEYDWHLPVRSIGIRCINPIDRDAPVQLSIFGERDKAEKNEKLVRAVDMLKSKYGDDILIKCGELGMHQDDINT